MKKTIMSVFIPICIAIILFSILICIGISINNNDKYTDKLQIITTIFPTYDFTRQIVGDKAYVTMLLQPAQESHSYEPSPQDIIKINESDLFIYTGENMETWADNIIKSSKNVNVLDVSNGITLISEEEIENNNTLEHEDSNENNHNHEHEYDPHIWTNPVYAIKMCENIEKKLEEIDPKNKEYYKENAQKYIEELKKLNNEIKDVVQNAKRKKIVSGSRFPFYYFIKEYGLEYEAAYDSCNNEAEPSAKVVANLVDIIKNENIPVIYYEELTEPIVAKSISNQTGCKMLLLHSAHNVSKEDFENGITYIQIMKQNLENLKEGLN